MQFIWRLNKTCEGEVEDLFRVETRFYFFSNEFEKLNILKQILL